MSENNLSWRQQLNRVRNRVEETEARRERLRQMELEKTREALSERLKKDTPQALLTECNELKAESKKHARRLYPPEALRQQLEAVTTLGEKIEFYEECEKEHRDLFSDQMRQTLRRLKREVADLKKGLQRQLNQWEPIENLLAGTTWRPVTADDAAQLLAISKEYNETAFSVTLSLPSDYYTREIENMYMAEYEDLPYGFATYAPDDNAANVAVEELEGVNFAKMIRGVIYAFYHAENTPAKGRVARVRLSHPAEFRYFADIGFSRAETKNIGESIFQWAMD